MGLEAQAGCRIGALGEPVKALLESTELILRGPTIRRRFDRAALKGLRVADGELRFEAGGEAVALELGPVLAPKWLLKLQTPPPSLAAKLGLKPGVRAALWGPLDDAALREALQGALVDDPAAATELLAVVHGEGELQQALRWSAALPVRSLWLVHEKGRGAALPDAAIRATLRALGNKDVKTCAVSARYTATRWMRSEPPQRPERP